MHLSPLFLILYSLFLNFHSFPSPSSFSPNIFSPSFSSSLLPLILTPRCEHLFSLSNTYRLPLLLYYQLDASLGWMLLNYFRHCCKVLNKCTLCLDVQQPRKPVEAGSRPRDQERFERPPADGSYPPRAAAPAPFPPGPSAYPLGGGSRVPPVRPPQPEVEPEADSSSFFDFIPFFGKKPAAKPPKPLKQQQQVYSKQQQLPPGPPGPPGPPRVPPQQTGPAGLPAGKVEPIRNFPAAGRPAQLPEKRIDTEESGSSSGGDATVAAEDKPFIVTAERVLPPPAQPLRPLAVPTNGQGPPAAGGQFNRSPPPPPGALRRQQPQRPQQTLPSQPLIGLPPLPPSIKQTPFSPKRPLVPPQLPAFPTASPPFPVQQRRPVAAAREVAGENKIQMRGMSKD